MNLQAGADPAGLLPGVSLRAGREIDLSLRIDEQIDDKTVQIKFLDTQ
jgi:hypothetical protein